MSQGQTVNAAPTKKFFVDMLTRDIELKDAILDLLDNCIDGVLRELENKTPQDKKKPYDGFKASITINKKEFIIADNCGGISKKIARESAFRMGKIDKDKRDEKLATVGMYGIGMKRAIFKMGRHCKVVSRHKSDAYLVEISPAWLEKEDTWDLKLVDKNSSILPEAGTKIHVTDLNEGIPHYFGDPVFVNSLGEDIARLFSLIINKGFIVELNNKVVLPVRLALLAPDAATAKKDLVEPYLFTAKIKGVQVNLAVGFYRTLAADSDIEDELDEPRSSETAGWTVICNDRVILYADKSMLTGWGRGVVPRYHNQYIPISGIVTFMSTHSEKLPLTTTKRGIDTSSEVYLTTLDFMSEGIKQFITFTNRWKGRAKEAGEKFKGLSSKALAENPRLKTTKGWQEIRKLKGYAQDARKFVPELPMPTDGGKSRLIQFRKEEFEINSVAKIFYKGMSREEVTPSEVGERCFDEFLKKSR
ncbi:MAG: ATP-binding protein [Alphaproteobacteria bacterium]|nr:MAG: ATP-binding protein [Alphaproteobacteria bacterium]